MHGFEKLFHQRPRFSSLEVDEQCRFDFVAVYDGSSTTSGLIGQVCGRVRPTFESSSDSLTVVLSTDYANSYRGFSASYTSIYTDTVNTSKPCSLSYSEPSEDRVRRNGSLIFSLPVALPACKPVTCTLEHIHNRKLEFCVLLHTRGN